MQKTLERGGFKVKRVMNITDVEDKIIRDAGASEKTIFEFVKPYEAAFFEDLEKLNIKPAQKFPKATEHIQDMIRLIQQLLKKKLAYVSEGSVYFDISKFKKYGRLSQLKSRDLKAGARVDSDEYEKNSAEDFVLWKAERPDEPAWDAPFGRGRPGWHIECSAMAMKYLGNTFDIHAGGVDLLFPHHENEIAQSEAASGKTFARFFMEGEHLLVEGQKMSKSIGNIFTLDNLEEKGFDPLAFRYLILTAHYRTKLNFTWESLEAAAEALKRLRDFVLELKKSPQNEYSPSLSRGYLKYKINFENAIANDLDTPKAIAIVWKLINTYRKSYETRSRKKLEPKSALELLCSFDNILGLELKNIKKEKIPAEIKKLAEKRERYRKDKNWSDADKIRDELVSRGWEIKDTPEGAELKKAIR